MLPNVPRDQRGFNLVTISLFILPTKRMGRMGKMGLSNKDGANVLPNVHRMVGIGGDINTIDMKSPDAVQNIQAATGWTRAKTRKFFRLHDETRCMERDEVVRARMVRS